MSIRCVLASLVLALGLVISGIAAAEAPTDSTRVSYWGPFPERADSVMARDATATRDAWEYPVDALWWVVSAPFEILRTGLRVTTVWLDESGTLERILDFIAPLDLPYGFVFGGSVGRLSGVAGTVGFFHDDFLVDGGRFRATSTLTSTSNRRIAGGIVLPGTRGGTFEIGGGYSVRTRARYFGLGPDAPESGESYFTRELGWAGLGYRQPLGVFDTRIEGDVLWSSVTSREPDIDDFDGVALSDRFAGSLPAGYGRESRSLNYDLGLVRDTTVQEGRPRTGSLQVLRASWYVPGDDAEADYVQYRAEVQQFFDLWWDRSLAVRSFWSYMDSNDEAIHFQRLMTNDDPDLLRGFEDFRWRDRGMTALSLEYRWPVWDYRDPGAVTLDAYTFYDGGQVFGNRREIALEELAHSYGFGFRMSVHKRFYFRVEAGFSEEDTVLRLRGDQMFQFGKDGLYHGRDPIPVR